MDSAPKVRRKMLLTFRGLLEPSAGNFELLSLGGGNKTGISAHFTHILTVTISGTMEPGHWATTGDQVIARKFLML